MGLKSSLDEILKNIERAKRNTFTKKDVILVAATKTRSFNQINQVYSLGIRHIGENRWAARPCDDKHIRESRNGEAEESFRTRIPRV